MPSESELEKLRAQARARGKIPASDRVKAPKESQEEKDARARAKESRLLRLEREALDKRKGRREATETRKVETSTGKKVNPKKSRAEEIVDEIRVRNEKKRKGK